MAIQRITFKMNDHIPNVQRGKEEVDFVHTWASPMYFEKGLYDVKTIIPECLDAKAVEVILPLHLYRTTLAVRKTQPNETISAIKKAFKSDRFKRTQGFALSYMLSNEMILATDFPGPPHVMIYTPDDYTREMSVNLGWNDQVVYHEGGPDAAYTAFVIIREGIEPAYEE
jgi:hypothetical protein